MAASKAWTCSLQLVTSHLTNCELLYFSTRYSLLTESERHTLPSKTGYCLFTERFIEVDYGDIGSEVLVSF